MGRKQMISVLVLLNVLLVGALVVTNFRPAFAKAQNADITERWIAISGEYQNNRDAVYLLDTRNRSLHVFDFQRGRNKLFYTASNDLEAIFRNN